MIFSRYSEDEIRNFCRQRIENLEYWLRHIVDVEMTNKFGPTYLDAKTQNGLNVISKPISDVIKTNFSQRPGRYSRLIDAALINDLFAIICKRPLYEEMFKKYFKLNYLNYEHLRVELVRLLEPRNKLSHANAITSRQAEQIICYSNDIIESIKEYYNENNMNKEFNVPRFTKFKDSIGNEIYFNSLTEYGRIAQFYEDSKSYLRPGDILEFEVEVDNSFEQNDYTIKWSKVEGLNDFGNTKKITITISEIHVGEEFCILCYLISNKNWHRINDGRKKCDDMIVISYKVLPPL